MNKLTFSSLYTPGTQTQFKEELTKWKAHFSTHTHFKYAFQYLELFKKIAPKDVCWTAPTQKCPNPFLLYRCTCSRNKVTAFHKKHRNKKDLMNAWERFHQAQASLDEQNRAFQRRVREKTAHSDKFIADQMCWVENVEGRGLKTRIHGDIKVIDALVTSGEATLVAIVQVISNPGDVARAAVQLERRCDLEHDAQGRCILKLEDQRVFKTKPKTKPERWIVTKSPTDQLPLLQTSMQTKLAMGLLEEKPLEVLWEEGFTMFDPRKQLKYFKQDGGKLIFID